MLKRIAKVLALSLLASIFHTTVYADTRVVSQDLESAMRSAKPGDTLIVADKSWPGSENVWIKSDQTHGEPGKPITVMGAPGTQPVLHGEIDIETDYWRLVNLHFRDGANVKFVTNGAEIRGCSFIGSGYAYGALIVDADVQDILIENNYFEIANERSTHHAIYIHAADNVVLRGNTVTSYGNNGMKGYGLHIYDENKGKGVDRVAHNYIIENNVIYGVHERAAIIVGYGGNGATLHGAVIRNNLIFDCNVGIMIKNNVFDIKVFNNTIYALMGDNPKGIQLRRVETDIEIKNNIIYSERGNHIELQMPENPNLDITNNLYFPDAELESVSDGNPIIDDPEFVKPGFSDYDFGLKSTSPAIDSGVDVGLPYAGSAPDLGAFEFGSISTDVKKKDSVIKPESFSLHQNYPNPFNPETRINFEIAEPARVTLQIFDVTGRAVATLVDDNLSAGSHSVTWNGANKRGQKLVSGVYFYRLDVVSQGKLRTSVTRKMILLQ